MAFYTNVIIAASFVFLIVQPVFLAASPANQNDGKISGKAVNQTKILWVTVTAVGGVLCIAVALLAYTCAKCKSKLGSANSTRNSTPVNSPRVQVVLDRLYALSERAQASITQINAMLPGLREKCDEESMAKVAELQEMIGELKQMQNMCLCDGRPSPLCDQPQPKREVSKSHDQLPPAGSHSQPTSKLEGANVGGASSTSATPTTKAANQP